MPPPVAPSATSRGNAHAAAAQAGNPAPQADANDKKRARQPPLPNGLEHLPPRAGKRSCFARAADAIASSVKSAFQTKNAAPAKKKETVYPDDPVKLRKIFDKKFHAMRKVQAEVVKATKIIEPMFDPSSKKFNWGTPNYWKHEIDNATKLTWAFDIANDLKASGALPDHPDFSKKLDKLSAAHAEYQEVLEKMKTCDPEFYYGINMATAAFGCSVQLIAMERSISPLADGEADPLVNGMAAKMGAEVARMSESKKNPEQADDPDADLHVPRWHGQAMLAGMLAALPGMTESMSSGASAHFMSVMDTYMKAWHAVQSSKDIDPAEKNTKYEEIHNALNMLAMHVGSIRTEHAEQAERHKSGEEVPLAPQTAA